MGKLGNAKNEKEIVNDMTEENEQSDFEIVSMEGKGLKERKEKNERHGECEQDGDSSYPMNVSKEDVRPAQIFKLFENDDCKFDLSDEVENEEEEEDEDEDEDERGTKYSEITENGIEEEEEEEEEDDDDNDDDNDDEGEDDMFYDGMDGQSDTLGFFEEGEDEGDDEDEDENEDGEKKKKKKEKQKGEEGNENVNIRQIAELSGQKIKKKMFINKDENIWRNRIGIYKGKKIMSSEDIEDRIKYLLLVLTNYKKKKGELKKKIKVNAVKKELLIYYEYHYQYSSELINYLFNLFDVKELYLFLEINNLPKEIHLRTNTLKITRNNLIKILKAQNVSVEKTTDWNDVGIIVNDKETNVGSLHQYLYGYYIIQSASSLIPVMELNVQPNDLVLDMCAAPGGKTTFIAALKKNKGIIFANDINRERCKVIQAQASRLGVSNLIITNFNALHINKKMNFKFDKILLDAPCTGTGVVNKKKNARRRTIKEIQNAAKKQKVLLNNAIDMLKNGGILVYSTCSITVEENEQVINYILKKRDVNVLPVETNVGDPGITYYRKKIFSSKVALCRRIYLHKHNSDNFFVAKLIKISDNMRNVKNKPTKKEKQKKQKKQKKQMQKEGEIKDKEKNLKQSVPALQKKKKEIQNGELRKTELQKEKEKGKKWERKKKELKNKKESPMLPKGAQNNGNNFNDNKNTKKNIIIRKKHRGKKVKHNPKNTSNKNFNTSHRNTFTVNSAVIPDDNIITNTITSSDVKNSKIQKLANKNENHNEKNNEKKNNSDKNEEVKNMKNKNYKKVKKTVEKKEKKQKNSSFIKEKKENSTNRIIKKSFGKKFQTGRKKIDE